MSSNSGKADFTCPEGCGRTFKTNSAAHAHAVHCKAKSDNSEDIVQRILPEIKQGIADLQERVQTNIINSLTEILPQMVAQQTDNMAGQIAEGLKKNPNAGFAQILGQANEFLETPLGKLIFSRIISGGSSARGNINDWRRGAQLAIRMLGANKSDPDATAQTIREFAGPYKGKAGNDLYRGMYETAEMFRPAKKEEPKPPVSKEEKGE